MTKVEFIEKLEKETGLLHHIDFGYVLGTHAPWEDLRGELIAISGVNGFLIWVKGYNDRHTKKFEPPFEIDNIIKFINERNQINTGIKLTSNSNMKVQIKLIENGKVPVKGEPNAMCFDCYVRKIEHLENGKVKCYLGFAATPPKGFGIRLIPRSNLTKYFWVLNNSIGVGDEDYKNEYLAIFTPLPKRNISIPQFSNGLDLFPYEVGDRVCQMEIYKREDFEFEQVEELSGNDRGGGFGSTKLK